MNEQAMAPPAGGPSTMIDEDRITRVARALCVADGNDPDAEVTIRMDLTKDNAHGDRYQGRR